MQIDVSIIIVNWNTKQLLEECLASVIKQTKLANYEVIVVDNASSDSSVEMLKEKYEQVILIENKENRGFAAANNQGIALAKGRYILLLNSDTIVLDGATDKVVSFADNNKDAAVIGCRVLNPDGTLQPTCFMFPSLLNMVLSSTYLYKIFYRSRFFGREQMTWWGRNDIREVDVVTGCFMLVRKEAIEEIGVLDERLFMYAEDTAWCYRFRKAGWKAIFTPDAQIIHFGGASSSKMKSKMRLQLSGSILLFIKEQKGLIKYIFACFFTALFYFLRIPYWIFQSIVSKESRNQALSNARTCMLGTILAFRGWKALSIKSQNH